MLFIKEKEMEKEKGKETEEKKKEKRVLITPDNGVFVVMFILLFYIYAIH